MPDDPAALAVAHEYLLEPSAIRRGAHARQSGGEAGGHDGLQKVVERVDLEGLDGVLVVGGGEDHLGQFFEAFQQFEAGHAGHLDVEEEKVGRELRDHRERFLAVARFAGDLDLGMLQQQAAQLQAGKALIVDDQGFHSVRGMTTVAVTRPSPLRRSRCARAP